MGPAWLEPQWQLEPPESLYSSSQTRVSRPSRPVNGERRCGTTPSMIKPHLCSYSASSLTTLTRSSSRSEDEDGEGQRTAQASPPRKRQREHSQLTQPAGKADPRHSQNRPDETRRGRSRCLCSVAPTVRCVWAVGPSRASGCAVRNSRNSPQPSAHQTDSPPHRFCSPPSHLNS